MIHALEKMESWRKHFKKGLVQILFEYIHKIMQRILLKIFSNDPLECITEVLSTKMKSSNKFLSYTKEILHNTKYASKVSKASGRITLQKNRSIMNLEYSLAHFLNYTWTFQTHKSFTLNITVENIQFSSDYLACYWGRIIIHKSKSLDNTFTYCGHQTNFNIYPSYNDVNITVISYEYFIFTFSASYTITNKNQIVSINTSNFKISWIYLIENHIFLYTFHIKVRKYIMLLFTFLKQHITDMSYMMVLDYCQPISEILSTCIKCPLSNA